MMEYICENLPEHNKDQFCSDHWCLFCSVCNSAAHTHCAGITPCPPRFAKMITTVKQIKSDFSSLIKEKRECLVATENELQRGIEYDENMKKEFTTFVETLVKDMETCFKKKIENIQQSFGEFKRNLSPIYLSTVEADVGFVLETNDKEAMEKMMSSVEEKWRVLNKLKYQMENEKSPTDLPENFARLQHIEQLMSKKHGVFDTVTKPVILGDGLAKVASESFHKSTASAQVVSSLMENNTCGSGFSETTVTPEVKRQRVPIRRDKFMRPQKVYQDRTVTTSCQHVSDFDRETLKQEITAAQRCATTEYKQDITEDDPWHFPQTKITPAMRRKFNAI